MILRALVPAMALLAALPAAQVQTLDGQSFAGEPVADGMQPAGTAAVVVRWADIARVAFEHPPWPEARYRKPVPRSTRPGGRTDSAAPLPVPDDNGVFLTDGSWLPGRVLSGDRPDHVSVVGAWGGFIVPLGAIRSWGRLPEDGGKDDLLLLSGGLTPGRILGFDERGLRFESPLTPEPLPLDRVAAAAVAGAPRPARPGAVVLWHQSRSDRPGVALVRRGEGWAPALSVPPATASDTVTGLLPPPPWIAVDGPRRVSLSDVPPSKVVEAGAFGVVWPWRKDRDLDGNPILLGGQWSSRGITVHSAATMAWQVRGQYRAFQARVGIADALGTEGDCILHIRGDGRSLAAHRLRGGDKPIALDIDLSGVVELVIEVALGERYDIGDHVVLADAALIRARR